MRDALPAPLLLLITVVLPAGCMEAPRRSHEPPGRDLGVSASSAADVDLAIASTGGGPIHCTPAQAFCVGSSLYTCTASGTDGTLLGDCAAGSSQTLMSNSMGCFPDHCPTGAACCRTTLPLCVATFTSDPDLSFTNWGKGDEACGFASVSSSTVSYPAFALSMSWPLPDDATGDYLYVTVPLLPDRIAPGGSAEVSTLLEAAGLPDHLIAMDRDGVHCQSWGGVIYFDADKPDWKIRLDLTCAESGKSDVKLAGTFTGTL